MIKVNMIAVGKLNEEYYKKAFSEYKKRLSRYCDFTLVEIEDCRIYEGASQREIANALDIEARRIEKAFLKNAENIAFCIEGEKISSEGYSKLISSGKNINLIIGSTHGLSPNITDKCRRISVSDMTFPHRLFRVMAIEQTYRAFQIAAGGQYHSTYQKK
jgi:23S rRNA (pseudouridine1915-N3)-methyltransferase